MILFAAKVSEVGGLVLLFSYLLEDIVSDPFTHKPSVSDPSTHKSSVSDLFTHRPSGKKVRRARDDTLLLFFFLKC